MPSEAVEAGRGLAVSAEALADIVAHAYRCYPEEACGLLAGDPATSRVTLCYPCRNAASSARVYTVEPRDHLLADRDAERRGLSIVGVFHSHTHTDPYPSRTDVEQAPDPEWHYVIVSLKREAPEIRSYRIIDHAVTEEPITPG